MNSDPYLFDDLPLPEPSRPVYTTPIEQAMFDIMELVDSFFRSSVTVEEYDCIQKKVKSILLEVVKDEKNHDPACTGKRPLLVMRNDTE